MKIIASNYDLDPVINFRLLSLLKKDNISDYDKYIIKYKYTLNYEDAKGLNCFEDDENKIKALCEKNFKQKIDNIKSLSKLKLFNFLFFLINLKYKEETLDDEYEDIDKTIRNTLELYENKANLVFKAPNNYGNYELQYYTYLELFINYCYKKITKGDDKNNDMTDEKDNNDDLKEDNDDIYFNWDKNSIGETEEIDMSKFDEKKEELSNFINKYLEENKTVYDININMEIENDEKEITKKNIVSEKKISKNTKKHQKIIVVAGFINMCATKLKIFEEELFYLFRQNDDDKIIQSLEFIYYSLLFRGDEEKDSIYDSYPNCLYNNPLKKNENLYYKFKNGTNEEERESIKTDDLVFANLELKFGEKHNNPFRNIAHFYKFPINIKKNIFQINQDIEKFFKDFLKEMYKSPLLEEIFYLTPEFNDFKYPFSDDEILDEMIENTVFIPFGNKVMYGYTQKLIARVYISSKLSENNFSGGDVSKIIIKLGLKLNTIIHEQLKHYLKGLLFYNSFRYKIKKRLDSDLSGYKQETFFIDNIRKIFSITKNITCKPVIDGGDRAEIYLYGYNLYFLYVGEALKMYNKSNWNLSVLEHLKQFNENNKAIKSEKTISLDKIENNNDFNDFIKQVFIQFGKFYKCQTIKILFNKAGSEKLKGNLNSIDEGQFLIDYRIELEKKMIKVPDTETDKKLLYMFEDY